MEEGGGYPSFNLCRVPSPKYSKWGKGDLVHLNWPGKFKPNLWCISMPQNIPFNSHRGLHGSLCITITLITFPFLLGKRLNEPACGRAFRPTAHSPSHTDFADDGSSEWHTIQITVWVSVLQAPTMHIQARAHSLERWEDMNEFIRTPHIRTHTHTSPDVLLKRENPKRTDSQWPTAKFTSHLCAKTRTKPAWCPSSSPLLSTPLCYSPTKHPLFLLTLSPASPLHLFYLLFSSLHFPFFFHQHKALTHESGLTCSPLNY